MAEFTTAKSPHHLSSPGARLARFVWVLLLGCPVPAAAEALTVTFSADMVQYQAYTVRGLTARMQDGSLVVRAQAITATPDTGLVLREPILNCASVDLNADEPCSAGAWSLTVADAGGGWQLPLDGTVSAVGHTNDAWSLRSSVNSGNLRARLSAQAGPDEAEANLLWEKQLIRDIPSLAVLPQQLHWVHAGNSSGKLALRWPAAGPASLRYEIDFNGLGFDSPEGRFAGENLAFSTTGSLDLGETLHGQIDGKTAAGDLLIENFYASFSGQPLNWSTQFSLRGSLLRLARMHLSDGRSVEIEADLELDLEKPLASLRYQVGHFEMHFPEAYERYLESVASTWTLDGLAVTGDLLWSAAGRANAVSSGMLDVKDLTIVDAKRGRFAVTGLATHVLPGDQGVESRFSWRGLLFQRINLGAGEAAVKADSSQFSLAQPLRLDVLGGHLAIDDLRVKLPGAGSGAGAEPEIRLYASLDNMDMKQLTKALAWPSFGGSISGRIPGVTLNEGVLAVEGQIEFNVFDGEILLSDLRIERPFGVLPSLAANLEVRDLDLQQLTSTFSFGNISGRMSGFVHDLRMLDWSPVAFDAWFGTPRKESGSHQISRQAVNRLTNIGGGSTTAALTGPIMKLFSNFSYKRLGLGCRLQNNICEVRGLDDDAASVLIMEGAGIPKIMIRAFNRQMDWPTLVKGLTAASGGESIRIGDKP